MCDKNLLIHFQNVSWNELNLITDGFRGTTDIDPLHLKTLMALIPSVHLKKMSLRILLSPSFELNCNHKALDKPKKLLVWFARNILDPPPICRMPHSPWSNKSLGKSQKGVYMGVYMPFWLQKDEIHLLDYHQDTTQTRVHVRELILIYRYYCWSISLPS